MKKQAVNPILPEWEYIPDGEPRIFGNRLYLYGSHDRFNGKIYCENSYVGWSAPLDALGNWETNGVTYPIEAHPHGKPEKNRFFAPDVVRGSDGRYYMYYGVGIGGSISVAVSDSPAGPFRFYSDVKAPDGHILGKKKGDVFQFDPGVLVDDDGRVFLYTGYGLPGGGVMTLLKKLFRFEGCCCYELCEDMCTVKSAPSLIVPQADYAKGTSFEEHPFFEASSPRKINGRYYIVYSSIHGHELCYGISDRPDGGFTFGGTIISNGDIYLNGRKPEDRLNYTGNTHGGLVEIDGQWYVFYHRHTNGHQYSRQGCAEPIQVLTDGSIPQVEITSCGLNGGPLEGNGTYGAYIACNLMSKNGAVHYEQGFNKLDEHPRITQDAHDGYTDARAYIANMQDGSVAGYKYFNLSETTKIAVEVRSNFTGKLAVSTELGGPIVAEIVVSPSKNYTWYDSAICAPSSSTPLYFTYRGEGSVDFRSFQLK